VQKGDDGEVRGDKTSKGGTMGNSRQTTNRPNCSVGNPLKNAKTDGKTEQEVGISRGHCSKGPNQERKEAWGDCP